MENIFSGKVASIGLDDQGGYRIWKKRGSVYVPRAISIDLIIELNAGGTVFVNVHQETGDRYRHLSDKTVEKLKKKYVDMYVGKEVTVRKVFGLKAIYFALV